MSEAANGGKRQGNFLAEGFRELGRKLARAKLRRAMRRQDAERLVALADLGRAAWEARVDLGAHAGLRDRLAGLDSRAGELARDAARLQGEIGRLEDERRQETEAFAARRKAAEAQKQPVDAALAETRSRKAASDQSARQAESRLGAIAARLSGLDRASAAAAPGPADGPEARAAERQALAAEQATLGASLARASEQSAGLAVEEARLADASRRHADAIAAIEAERKTVVGRLESELARVRAELQGTTRQTGAVGKDRDGAFGELGAALFAAGNPPEALAAPCARVAAVDRERERCDGEIAASLSETRALPGSVMATFWAVLVGVPVVLVAAGLGLRQALKPAPVARKPAPAAVAAPAPERKTCEATKAPDNGQGVAVRSDCQRREGVFAGGQLVEGKITFPDGRVREGRFVGGLQAGKGTLSWPDGRRYTGHFVDGRSLGPGEFVAADGTRDRGNFKSGARLHGIGSRTFPDGSVLFGEFDHGSPAARMIRVRQGKAEVVDGPATAPPAGSPATVEPVGR